MTLEPKPTGKVRLAQAWQADGADIAIALDGRVYLLPRHIAKSLARSIVENL